MYAEPQRNTSSDEMLCLKFSKLWSENFKDEMLSLEEAWEDVTAGFKEMEDAIEWMQTAMQDFLKVFSEYEWLESYARVEVPNGQKYPDPT